MNKFTAMVAAMLALPGMAATPQSEEAVVRIKGMACEMCSKRIVEVLEKRPDIDAVEINFTRGLALVRYDGAALDAPGLQAAVERLGFDVDGVLSFPADRLLLLPLRAPAWAGKVDINAELARQVTAASPGFNVIARDDSRGAINAGAASDTSSCDKGTCALRLGQAAGARYVAIGRLGSAPAGEVVRLDVFDCATGVVVTHVTIKKDDFGGLAEPVRVGVGELVGGIVDARRSRALDLDEGPGSSSPVTMRDGRAPPDRPLTGEP